MKKIFLVFTLLVFTVVAYSQEKMKYEDWQKEMAIWTAKRDSLKGVLDKINAEVEALKKQLAEKDAQIKKLQDEIYALVGSSEEGVKEFAQMLDEFERKLNELSRLSNEELYQRRAEVEELVKKYDELKSDKRSALSQYYDRVVALGEKVENLSKVVKALVKTKEGKVVVAEAVIKEVTYTVGTWQKDRDCLWNIAKKPTIYDDPWLWPKIYVANRDKIKDPDLIYPGWVLKIPPKAELNAEEKKAATIYYRRKAREEAEKAKVEGM